MSYKAGEDVIVVQDGVNRVGAVLDKHVINKQVVYDVLLENRSAVIYVSTMQNAKTRIDKHLTKLLCESEAITSTIPYKEMLANEALPICHA
jgi:hypothetical protein